jgi:probable HAF family extracellular repeat protein
MRNGLRGWLLSCVALMGILRGLAAHGQATFTPLGFLPGTIESGANAVSFDGTVVVGNSKSANGAFEAFRWTNGEGMVGLGDLPGGSFFSTADGVSADGSVVVGKGSTANGSEAFRWTANGGIVGLGNLPGGARSSAATDVSHDGSIVIGTVSFINAPFESFRWTAASGMVRLGELPMGAAIEGNEATGVSGDGSVVVGTAHDGSGTEAFQWNASSNAFTFIGNLSNVNSVTSAGDISADGSWWGRATPVMATKHFAGRRMKAYRDSGNYPEDCMSVTLSTFHRTAR